MFELGSKDLVRSLNDGDVVLTDYFHRGDLREFTVLMVRDDPSFGSGRFVCLESLACPHCHAMPVHNERPIDAAWVRERVREGEKETKSTKKKGKKVKP